MAASSLQCFPELGGLVEISEIQPKHAVISLECEKAWTIVIIFRFKTFVSVVNFGIYKNTPISIELTEFDSKVVAV